MQSSLYIGVYTGSTIEGVIRQGDVTDICRIDFNSANVYDSNLEPVQLTVWEVRPRWANVEDDWTPVDRLDLVIPGHPTERSIEEMRQYLAAR